MSNFNEFLQEYKNLYTTWCQFGMPGGIVKWHQGRGGSGYTTCPGISVDIEQCCNEGKYVDEHKPWLYYDKAADSVTLYSVHYKTHSETLIFNVKRSSFPKHELSNYATQHALHLNIMLGRRPFEKSKDAEVIVLQGKHSDFIAAGWEKEIQEELRQKELKAEAYRKGCEETRKRIASSISMISQAYDSAAMTEVESYQHSYSGSAGVFYSRDWDYTLYLHGVMWHKLKHSIIEGSWFMPFSKVGYGNLETDDQLFYFATAMFCRKNGIEPNALDVEKITWNCEIKNNHNGRYINNPVISANSTGTKTDEPVSPLKPIF